MTARKPGLLYLCAFTLAVCAQTCMAQAVDPREDSLAYSGASALPSWIVPVLRLVSATHVEPTTGVVLSAEGLVLVPASFAAAGDEIIVLDGGTDIVRNGRPATIMRRFPEIGLKVLQVPGLRREGAPMPAEPLHDGEEVRLMAFPPAEMIARGEPPLAIPARIAIPGEGGAPALASETSLPNVTGALLDACGNLAAFSVASGVQRMEVVPATRHVWRDELLAVFAELGLSPGATTCARAGADAAAPQASPEQPGPEAESEPVEPPAPEDESTPEQPEEDSSPPQLPDLDILPPIEREPALADHDEAEPPGTTAWWWLAAAMALFGAGFAVHRLRSHRPPVQPAATATEDPPGPPASQAPTETEPALDSRLILSGSTSDGVAVDAAAATSARAVNLLIGRGDVDLRLDSAAVSRRHARLNGSAGELTLTDLGSNNGTFINGVPCLEGEIMYVEPGDTLVFGDVSVRFEIEPTTND
jgi:hypothetical protein